MYLQRRISRHGKIAWYVRLGRGPLIRIRETYGTTKFDEAYQAATRGDTVRAGSVKGGTLGWLIEEYQKAPAWTGLSKATHKQRNAIFKPIIESSGNDPISSTDNAAIKEAYARRSATPFQAKNFLNTMRKLFEWAVDAGKVDVDPTAGVKAKTPRTKGFLPWTDEDIEKFEKRWAPGTRQRIMLDVYCYTGLRRGDAARVGPQHVKNGTINIYTEKGGEMVLVSIPMLQALKDSLAAGPTGIGTFICQGDGSPYVKESLGNVFGDACRKAGLVDRAAHGLRKAAAERAAENGATEKELEAIFGWDGGRMAALYTRNANRKKLAHGAMSKMERAGV